MSDCVADPDRWSVVSPWLDRLLDANAAERTRVLAAAAAADPALPAELSAWLAPLEQEKYQSFMQSLAVAGGQGPDAAVPAPPADAAGQRVGAYVLQRLLGQGGMGSVWLARRADGRYDGQVAIKFLHGGLLGRGGAQRFAREGQILARLDHPHIARLLDAGLTAAAASNLDAGGAQPYLVLEYVQGVPIDDFVRLQALDARATVRLFMDVLAAVSHAHERLTLHRDLKPSNILVTPQGQVKLLDFGIAKLVSDTADTAVGAGAAEPTVLTQHADRAYTLRYAAPEQLQGGEATTATDVYALGVLLHVLLTGGLHPTAAPAGNDPLAQLNATVHAVPRLASATVARQGGAPAQKLARALKGDLDTIIARALKKAPALRYRNAAELADDLRRYLNHESITARPDSWGYRLVKFLRRHRWGVAAVASVMLALGVGTVLALHSAREAQAQRRAAQEQSARAEKLVAFMLEDLRPRLESINRLDLMDAVGAKVLGYFENEGASNTAITADAGTLSRRVQALTLVGRIAQLRGQLVAADSTLAQALASQAELTRRAPGNAQVLFAHADILAAAGQVHRLQGDLAKAESEYRESLALNQRAHALKPDLTTLDRVVDAQSNLANFHMLTGQTAAALALFQEGQVGALRLAQATPAAWNKVAGMRYGIASVQYQQGRLSASAATAQAVLQALAQVPNGDRDEDARSWRAGALFRLGGTQLALGQAAEAAATLAEAAAIEAEDHSRAPDNFQSLSVLVQLRSLWIEALTWAGRRAQAQAQLQLAQADLARLLQQPDAPLDWRLRWRGSVLLQRALLAPQDPQLLPDLQAYVDEFTGPQPPGVAFTAAQWRIVAEAGLRLGDLLAARRQDAAAPARAQAAWHNAWAALRASEQPGFPTALPMAAELQQRLGQLVQAQALAAEVDKGEFRHPAYAAWRREMESARPSAAIR